jgi:hydroxyethylthiazole kinase
MKTEALAAVLENLREKKPLILSLTNSVVQNFTANMLLAVGASPVMLNDAEECSQLLEVCGGGLLVNVGTLSHAQAEVMRCAVDAAHAAGIPWVLDPVAVGLLGFRTEFCRELLSMHPTLIRGNASEIMALAGEAAGGRGTDTTEESSAAVQAARKLAQQCGCTVLVTGPVDYVTDGTRLLALGNGDELMTRVTGVGCAMGALAAACVAAAPDCFTGAAACAAILGLAGERAASRCPRPGSFAAALLDELDALTPADVVEFTRIVQDSDL